VLAYTALGLLLLMNRMVDRRSEEWPRWVLLLGLGGVVGNFIFSLTDHAQNGSYRKTEWIPVWNSTLAVSLDHRRHSLKVRPLPCYCAATMIIRSAGASDKGRTNS
jgi:hypothetical protein